MSRLYLECYSGISGDMTVGALLDLGADPQVLQDVLATVPVKGFETKISTVQKSAINACDFDVVLAEDNHDHDMAYLYGPESEYAQEEAHTEAAEHGEHHHHHHEHRNLADVTKIINETKMTEGARSIALRIFTIVAEAESEVHGRPIEEVHFHEVGAVDSIVDIISIAVCYDNLRTRENITDVIVPVLYEGQGTVRCQHGQLPVPVPAVASIVRRYGIRMHVIPDEGEFVTPTGAAAVAALRSEEKLPELFTIRKIGLGAGKRDYHRAGVVRAMLID